MKVNETTWLDTASHQHGAISHGQLLSGGLTSRQVERRAAAGHLVRIHRGVYRVAGAPESYEQSAIAACLAVGGVASHRCAAALWGLRQCESTVVEVTVANRRRSEHGGIECHSSLHLPAVDITERLSVPVTTPARTLVDLAAVASADCVESALEDALHRRLVTPAWLERTACRSPARAAPGAGVIRRLLADRNPAQLPTESTLEDELVRILRRAGLPEPVRQHPIPRPGLRPFRIDVSYPGCLVAIEGQSVANHTGRTDLQRDCDKRNLLVRLGWRVLVFTWDDAKHRPAFVVDTVRAALGV